MKARLTSPEDMIQEARNSGQNALSEYRSKQLLSLYGIPVTREGLARTHDEAASVADEVGYPVAVKACSPHLMHKSEGGLVILDVRNESAVRDAFGRIVDRAEMPLDGVLVQEMFPGQRELVLGLNRDPQFGPCVMLGLGGVLTEVLQDASFRMAPLDLPEALDMVEDLRSRAMLGPFRGQAPVDLEALGRCLIALGRIGMELEAVSEIDVNPLIVARDGSVKAVDALVVLKGGDHD